MYDRLQESEGTQAIAKTCLQRLDDAWVANYVLEFTMLARP